MMDREANSQWYKVREMLGDAVKKTDSDVGSLKVGNGTFTLLIPNGYGDGTTRYAVADRADFNSDMMEYFATIEGSISIYDYDCGDYVAETIEGRYRIYTYDGIVAFVRQ